MTSQDLWGPIPDGTRRLVLWRHGRTAWNAVGRAQGWANVSLDDVGRAQAVRAARDLASFRPCLLWSSDLARARETAEALVVALGAGGPALRLDERLREFDVGLRQSLTMPEFAERHPVAYARFMAGDEAGVPGAELTAHVEARMLAVLAEAVDTVPPGEIGVLVGHGASLRNGLLAFLGVPTDLGNILGGMANCAWAVLEVRPNGVRRLLDYNARTLPEPLDLSDAPHP